MPVEQAFFAPSGVCGRVSAESWADQAANPQHPGPVGPFFSAADGPVEPLWFSLGQDRGRDDTHNRAGDGNLSELLGNV